MKRDIMRVIAEELQAIEEQRAQRVGEYITRKHIIRSMTESNLLQIHRYLVHLVLDKFSFDYRSSHLC